MQVNSIEVDGVVRFTWDSETGVTEYADDGVTVVSTRAFTESEQAYSDSVEVVTLRDTTADLYGAAKAAIVTLRAGLVVVDNFASGVTGTDAQIKTNPQVYMRALASEVAEIERTVIALAMLVAGEAGRLQ